MPSTPEFENAYKQLNTKQKEAVDAIEGPVMVVAGPGTGKTQILTLRIANILLQTDTEPENILALTFTESGVQSMCKRLVELIGSPGYQVAIQTFHGFANEVIKDNPEEFPRIIGSRSISTVDQIALIESIVESAKLELLKPFGDTFYFVRSIVGSISDLKREGVSLEEFGEAIARAQHSFENSEDLYHEKGAHKGKMKGKHKDREKQIAKNRELAEIYRNYQNRLTDEKKYDFDDMIMELLRALRENGDLLLRLQEQYQYLLVDEHQDTNNAQNKIIELLASHHAPNPNLFVVGDEKQSIFRFQGASLENFYYIKQLYPDVRLVTLTENYRSSQAILNSADSLLASEAKLNANAGFDPTPIEVYAFSTPLAEQFFIANDIKQRLEGGCAPHEVAVLYRDNKDAFPIADTLEKMGVPFQIESDQDIFAHSSIKKLMMIARAIADYGNDRALADFLHLDLFDLDPLDVFKLIRGGANTPPALFDRIADQTVLHELGIANPGAITAEYENLIRWVKRSKNTELARLFQEILRESGLLKRILSSTDAQEELETLESFFDEVRAIVSTNPEASLGDFFAYLSTVRKHNVPIKKKKSAGKEGFVRLMTAHRSKGQEFMFVYVVNAYNGKWGNKRRPELLALLPEVYELVERLPAQAGASPIEHDANDDERRLFYVALTRAKAHARITYARENTDGRELLPSQFIDEIDPSLITIMDPTPFEQAFEEHRAELFEKAPVLSGRVLKDREFVTELFQRQGVSATSLNNYLACPWRYFYRSLLRLPEPEEPHLMFGQAVHAALDHLFTKLRRGGSLGKAAFVDYFEKRLRTHPLLPRDLERYVKKGRDALGGWHDIYSKGWSTETETEFTIRGIELVDGVTLTGKLDKLEFQSDSEVVVVDYKTGRPKTRNQILGKTKTSDASIFRQLVFYKLLLERYKDGVYTMHAAEVDFVEPDPKSGKYRKERFEVGDEEVDELVATIKRVASEITTVSFWEKRCGEEGCEYCELRDMLEE
ncbi:MAG: ATP-dependent DNA helicase [Candidatus Paceibacterota bacterium]